MCVTHYFDDYCVCELDHSCRSGQSLLWTLHTLLGMPLARAKHVPAASSGVFLGIMHDFSELARSKVAYMRPKPGRARALVAALSAIVLAGFALTSQVATLRGKLQFLLATVGYGSRAIRSVSAALASFRRGGRGIRLTDRFLQAADFCIAFLEMLPDRAVDLRRMAAAAARSPVLVWSDAMWEEASPRSPAHGGIGFVVWLPPDHTMSPGPGGGLFYGWRRASLADVPWRARDHHLIGQLELLAAAAVYTSMPGVFLDSEVIHFVDNTSAVYGLVKGYSARPDSAGVILAFHLCGLALRCGVWFNYVASKANVADLPSRGAISEMVRILRKSDPSFERVGRLVPTVLPTVAADLSAAWAAAEQLAAQATPPAAAPPRPRRHVRAGKRGR